jgi:exonuclease SbcD
MGGLTVKFIHIADLHLGKMLHGYQLIDIERELLTQITDYLNAHEDITAVVIAGDVYDRSIPSQEAVNLLNDFLVEIITHLHRQVLIIAGNHDGADRLNFGSEILKRQGLYIEANVKEKIAYVDIEDVRFYLFPFVKPSGVAALFPDLPHANYNEAVASYLSKQDFTTDMKKVMVTHQYVGHSAQVSDSECLLSVGGGEIVDPDLFDDFDYVALGHLHSPQYIKRKTLRYSGSLAKFSFDEAKQEKSFVVVDTDDFSFECVPLTPSLDVRVLKGTLEELMTREDEHSEDLISAELADEKIIPHAIDQLRTRYPHILKITYPKLLGNEAVETRQLTEITQMEPGALFEAFYQDVTGKDHVDPEDVKLIRKLFKGGSDA